MQYIPLTNSFASFTLAVSFRFAAAGWLAWTSTALLRPFATRSTITNSIGRDWCVWLQPAIYTVFGDIMGSFSIEYSATLPIIVIIIAMTRTAQLQTTVFAPISAYIVPLQKISVFYTKTAKAAGGVTMFLP